jgi:DNA-binding MarR family transcriptional regulator
MHALFVRALELAGSGSQSQWLLSQVRRFIREQRERFGEDLFAVLTSEEADVIAVIENGAAEFAQIVQESLVPEARVSKILESLIERNLVVKRFKGAPDKARGAKVELYFVRQK